MINKKVLATTFIVRVIMVISSFSLLIMSSRYLGATGRGMISLYIANVTIVQLISEIIFGPGYIYTAQRISFGKLFTAGILWSLLSSIIVPIILLRTHIQSPELFSFLVINSFLIALITGIIYQLQSVHHNLAFTTINLIQSISSLCITWFLLNQQATVQLFCLAQSCSYILASLSGAYFLWKYYKNNPIHNNEMAHDSLKESFRTGLIAQYSNFFNFLNTRIGFYLIFIVLGNIKELGVFAVAVSLSESVWIISNTLATWLYPQIASSKDLEANIDKTLSNAYVAFWYSFTYLLILLIIPEHLYVWVLGNDFTGVKLYISLLIPGTLMLAYGKIFWNYFSGTGQFHINNYSSLVSSVIAITSSIPLMYHFRINGIAIATSIGYITYTTILIGVFLSRNNINIKKALPSFKLLP